MQNKEQAPARIFDWLEKNDFGSLNNNEQEEILEYFSEEEYSDMRLAAITLQAGKEETHRRSLKRSEVLGHFDRVHANISFLGVFLKPTAPWKIAAVLLPFVLAWIVFSMFRSQTAFAAGTVASVDTVFVTKIKESAPVYVHDTVFKSEKKEAAEKGMEKITNVQQQVNTQTSLITEDFPVLPLDDSNSPANLIKGNSMLDDSLWRRFIGNTL